MIAELLINAGTASMVTGASWVATSEIITFTKKVIGV
jgi:hypothetical protein